LNLAAWRAITAGVSRIPLVDEPFSWAFKNDVQALYAGTSESVGSKA